MPSHRAQRIAEAIREVVASAILFDLNDPRVQGVTVLRAEVSADLRQTTVFVSLMGTEAERKLAFRALQHASGYLQRKVAERLQTRVTPVLRFKQDPGVKASVSMSQLIDQALEQDRSRHAPSTESHPAREHPPEPDEPR